MEKSRLPLFRRRKLKSPKRAPSMQSDVVDPSSEPGRVSRCHQVADQETCVINRDKDGVHELNGGAERSEPPSSEAEIQTGNVVSDTSANVEKARVIKPSETGILEEVIQDKVEPEGTRVYNSGGGEYHKPWQSCGNFLSPKDVISTAISGRSALISEEHSHYSRPLSKDLLEQVNLLNTDNRKESRDEDISGRDFVGRKQHSRSNSATSDSSTSPHHDYVELDYGVVYEECMPSPDYTELNLQSSFSSSDKSEGSTPGAGLTAGHQSADGLSEGHYSRLCQRNEAVSGACQYKQRADVSNCSCPCCVDVNEALSEGDVEVIDAAELGGGGGGGFEDMSKKRAGRDVLADADDDRPQPWRDAGRANEPARVGDDRHCQMGHCAEAHGPISAGPDHNCDGGRRGLQAGHGVCLSARESPLSGSEAFGSGSAHRGGVVTSGVVKQERIFDGGAPKIQESQPSADARPCVRKDLRVNILDVDVSLGYGTPYSPPHSAPPHKMSMDSIPELTETSGSYDEIPNLLLPGLLSPTHQGSLSRLSTRRPSCGVRMAEIRAGMRHGVESLRGSGSLCGEFPSRESLSRDSSVWSVKDFVQRSPSKESLRTSVVTQGTESSRTSFARDSPDVSSDSSQDNSLRISRRDCQKLRKGIPLRGPSLPLTPTSNSSQDSTPSDSPRRLLSAHHGSSHISRSVSDDHCVVQSLLQHLHSAKSGARREQFRHSWETSSPSCSQVYSQNPPYTGSMSAATRDVNKVDHVSERPYTTLSGIGQICTRDIGSISGETSPTWSYEYVDPEEDAAHGSQAPGSASLLPASTPKSSNQTPTTSSDMLTVKHHSVSAMATPLSGVSQSTSTTTSVTYTRSQSVHHNNSMHIRNSDPTNWAAHSGATENQDPARHSYPEISMYSQHDIHAFFASGSNTPSESLVSLYEHVYEEPASVMSPDGVTDMDILSSSDTLKRSHSAISGHYATLPCRTKPLPKSSSSPSQFKTAKMTLPQDDLDTSSVKLSQPFDSFRRRQQVDIPSGHGSLRHRHIPDSTIGVDFIRQDISGVKPMIDSTGTLGLKKDNGMSYASPPAPDKTPKLKYAEVKPVKTNKSPKTSIFQSKIGMMFQRKNKDGKSHPSEASSQNKKTQLKEVSKPRSDAKLPGNTQSSSRGSSPKHKPSSGPSRTQSVVSQSSAQCSDVLDTSSPVRRKDQCGTKPSDPATAPQVKPERSGHIVKPSSTSSRSESPQIQKGKKGIPGFSRLRHPSGSNMTTDGKSGKPRPVPLPMPCGDQNHFRREESLSPRNKSPSNPVIQKAALSRVSSGSKVPVKAKGQSTPVSSPPPGTPTRIKSPDGFGEKLRPEAAKVGPSLHKQSFGDKGQRARSDADQQAVGYPGLVVTKYQRQDGQENASHGRRDSQDGAGHLRRDSQDKSSIPKVQPPSRVVGKLDKAQYGKFLQSSLYSGSVSMHISSSGGEAMSSPRTEELIQPSYCGGDLAKVKYGKTRMMRTSSQESKPPGKTGEAVKGRLTKKDINPEHGDGSPPKSQASKVKVTSGTQTEPSLLPRGPRLQRNSRPDRLAAGQGQAGVMGDKDADRAPGTPSQREPLPERVGDRKPASRTAAQEYNQPSGNEASVLPSHHVGCTTPGAAVTPPPAPPPRLVRPYASLSRTRPLFAKFGFGSARQGNASGTDAIPEENASSSSAAQATGRDKDAVAKTCGAERDRHSECSTGQAAPQTPSVTATCNRGNNACSDNEGNKYQAAAICPPENSPTKPELSEAENEPSTEEIHKLDNCSSTQNDNDNDNCSVNDTGKVDKGQVSGSNDCQLAKDGIVSEVDQQMTPAVSAQSPACQSKSRDLGEGQVPSLKMAASDLASVETNVANESGLDEEARSTEDIECLRNQCDDARVIDKQRSETVGDSSKTRASAPETAAEVKRNDGGDQEVEGRDDELSDGEHKTAAETEETDCRQLGSGSVKGQALGGDQKSGAGAAGSGCDDCISEEEEEEGGGRLGASGRQTTEPPARVNRPSDVCTSDVAVRRDVVLTVAKQRCVNDAPVDGASPRREADTGQPDVLQEAPNDPAGINEINTVRPKAGDPIKSDARWLDGLNANECPLDLDPPSPAASPPQSPANRVGSSPEISPKDAIELVDSFLDSGNPDSQPNNSPPKSRAPGPGDITCHFALQDSVTLPPDYHGNTFPDSWPSMPDMRPLTKSKMPVLDPVQYGSLDRRKVLPSGKRYSEILPSSVGTEENTAIDSDSSEAGNGHEIWETFHSGLTQGGGTGNADAGTFGNLRLSESGYDSWKSHDSGSTIQMGKESRMLGLGGGMIQEEPKQVADSWIEKCRARDEDEMTRDRDSDGATTISTISLASDANSARTKSCPFGSRTSVTSQDTLHADDMYGLSRIQKGPASDPDKRADAKSPTKPDSIERDRKGFAGDFDLAVTAIRGQRGADVWRDGSPRPDSHPGSDSDAVGVRPETNEGVDGRGAAPEPASSRAGSGTACAVNGRDPSEMARARSGGIADDGPARETASSCPDNEAARRDGGRDSDGASGRDRLSTAESRADSDETITPGSENTGAEFRNVEADFAESPTTTEGRQDTARTDTIVSEMQSACDRDLRLEQPAPRLPCDRNRSAADVRDLSNRWLESDERSVENTGAGPFVPGNERDIQPGEIISHRQRHHHPCHQQHHPCHQQHHPCHQQHHPCHEQHQLEALAGEAIQWPLAGSWKVTERRDTIDVSDSGDCVRIRGASDGDGRRLDGGGLDAADDLWRGRRRPDCVHKVGDNGERVAARSGQPVHRQSISGKHKPVTAGYSHPGTTTPYSRPLVRGESSGSSSSDSSRSSSSSGSNDGEDEREGSVTSQVPARDRDEWKATENGGLSAADNGSGKPAGRPVTRDAVSVNAGSARGEGRLDGSAASASPVDGRRVPGDNRRPESIKPLSGRVVDDINVLSDGPPSGPSSPRSLMNECRQANGAGGNESNFPSARSLNKCNKNDSGRDRTDRRTGGPSGAGKGRVHVSDHAHSTRPPKPARATLTYAMDYEDSLETSDSRSLTSSPSPSVSQLSADCSFDSLELNPTSCTEWDSLKVSRSAGGQRSCDYNRDVPSTAQAGTLFGSWRESPSRTNSAPLLSDRNKSDEFVLGGSANSTFAVNDACLKRFRASSHLNMRSGDMLGAENAVLPGEKCVSESLLDSQKVNDKPTSGSENLLPGCQAPHRVQGHADDEKQALSNRSEVMEVCPRRGHNQIPTVQRCPEPYKESDRNITDSASPRTINQAGKIQKSSSTSAGSLLPKPSSPVRSKLVPSSKGSSLVTKPEVPKSRITRPVFHTKTHKSNPDNEKAKSNRAGLEMRSPSPNGEFHSLSPSRDATARPRSSNQRARPVTGRQNSSPAGLFRYDSCGKTAVRAAKQSRRSLPRTLAEAASTQELGAERKKGDHTRQNVGRSRSLTSSSSSVSLSTKLGSHSHNKDAKSRLQKPKIVRSESRKVKSSVDPDVQTKPRTQEQRTSSAARQDSGYKGAVIKKLKNSPSSQQQEVTKVNSVAQTQNSRVSSGSIKTAVGANAAAGPAASCARGADVTSVDNAEQLLFTKDGSDQPIRIGQDSGSSPIGTRDTSDQRMTRSQESAVKAPSARDIRRTKSGSKLPSYKPK